VISLLQLKNGWGSLVSQAEKRLKLADGRQQMMDRSTIHKLSVIGHKLLAERLDPLNLTWIMPAEGSD